MIDSMIDYKAETRKQWNETPCGSTDGDGKIARESREWFDSVRHSRYHVSDSWMPRVIPFAEAKGKRLLEIGHGLGSDLLAFAEHGAEVYGVDITPEHHRLAKKNFELHGRSVELKLCDASQIEYPSEFFDVVYSHGVLHHTPDTVRCIGEAYRVLKPGGLFILSLYRFWSAFHLVSWLFGQGVLHGKLWKLGYEGLMSTVEVGADGVHVKPLVKTYSKRQLRYMLADFCSVRFQAAHFRAEHVLGRPVPWVPAFFERSLEPALGWYLVALARK